MGACPTCGGWWHVYVRVRRGGRAYVQPGDRRRWYTVRGHRVGGVGPEHAMRVYWPGQGRYRSCPDLWHKRSHARQGWAAHTSKTTGTDPVTGLPIVDWGPDPYTGLNQHGDKRAQEQRRKTKARREKRAQSKSRR